MKNIITALVLTLAATGCLTQTEAEPAPAEAALAACAPVACAFEQGTCSEVRGMAHRTTTHFDDGAGCWYRTATCYPAGTPAECIPADCYEETGSGCGL
jgi:hypothetical protein